MPMQRLSEEPIWGTLLVALGLFWVPVATWFLSSVCRQRHLDRLEAESLRDEGYPPPDPPTTDSQPLDELD